MKQKKVTVVAEIPESMLEQWRLFVVLHGGKVLAPVDQDEVEALRKKVRYYEGELTKRKVTNIIDSVRVEICGNYCVHTKACNEAIDNGEEFYCPLDRL